MSVYKSPVLPIHDVSGLSIPQFMTQYNPDEVPASKIVHVETFSNETITYGSLHDQAARAAWGLRVKLDLQPGDTLLALVNNSVIKANLMIFLVLSNSGSRMPLYSLLMRPGGLVLFSRECPDKRLPLSNFSFSDSDNHSTTRRPLNTSATQEDIVHAINITNPTHIVTVKEKLSQIQSALASLSQTSIKIVTIRCKIQNLPQVCV